MSPRGDPSFVPPEREGLRLPSHPPDPVEGHGKGFYGRRQGRTGPHSGRSGTGSQRDLRATGNHKEGEPAGSDAYDASEVGDVDVTEGLTPLDAVDVRVVRSSRDGRDGRPDDGVAEPSRPTTLADVTTLPCLCRVP